MKSYGRAPTFLMLTGYEQVRSVVAFLAGDLEAARRVELVLPESGMCSSKLPGTDVPCCGPKTEPASSGGAVDRDLPVLAGGGCGQGPGLLAGPSRAPIATRADRT